MPLSSPFHLTALAIVLSLAAAATIVVYQPATGGSWETMAENVVNTALRP